MRTQDFSDLGFFYGGQLAVFGVSERFPFFVMIVRNCFVGHGQQEDTFDQHVGAGCVEIRPRNLENEFAWKINQTNPF